MVTLGTAVLTGLLFGLAPALGSSRHELVEAFKAGVVLGSLGAYALSRTLEGFVWA